MRAIAFLRSLAMLMVVGVVIGYVVALIRQEIDYSAVADAASDVLVAWAVAQVVTFKPSPKAQAITWLNEIERVRTIRERGRDMSDEQIAATIAEMQRFADERGVDYELLVDHAGELDAALRIVQYPVTLFVSAGGEIVAQTGALNEADLRRHVDELLA